MPETTPACRSCRQPACESLGALPDRSEFAGTALSRPLPGGMLYRCPQCRLVFRAPILTPDEYGAMYAAASAGVWAATSQELRTDQALVKAHLEASLGPGARVLDIGCFTGTLLSALGGDFRKFGIEKSADAAQVCRNAGIEIIGDDLYAVGALQDKFDAVVAMDVIEHTVDPAGFVRSALALLKDDGLLLITTGDADNPLWKRLKADFWYCLFAEHISFISPEWLRRHGPALGYRIDRVQLFTYEHVGSAKKLAKQALLWASRLLGFRPGAYWSAHLSRDHLFAVIRRT
jgi:SAM-dependent methyltransferase